MCIANDQVFSTAACATLCQKSHNQGTSFRAHFFSITFMLLIRVLIDSHMVGPHLYQ